MLAFLWTAKLIIFSSISKLLRHLINIFFPTHICRWAAVLLVTVLSPTLCPRAQENYPGIYIGHQLRRSLSLNRQKKKKKRFKSETARFAVIDCRSSVVINCPSSFLSSNVKPGRKFDSSSTGKLRKNLS